MLTLLLAARAGADPVGSAFRVSFTGSDTDTAYAATDPSLAYNPQTDQYLSVWDAVTFVDTSTGDIKRQILGRFLDATGNPVGPVISISDESGLEPGVDARGDPEVTYNSRANEFMVAWHGVPAVKDQGSPCATANQETEIFVQRLSASGGELGTNDQQLSSGNHCARDPQLAFSPASDRYMVVWANETATCCVADVFGQLLAGDGSTVGSNFQVSGAATFNNGEPDMAYDPSNDQFLVVFTGTNTGGNEEFDQYVLGQRYSGTGAALGGNVAISDPRGAEAAATFNPQAGEFLVVWQKDKPESIGPPSPTNTTQELRARRLDPSGAGKGAEFVVSAGKFEPAKAAKVAYDPFANQYMLVFEGTIPGATTADDVEGVWGQRLDATGTRIGTEGFEIANAPGTDPEQPEEPRSIVFNTRQCEFLTAWEHPVVSGSSRKIEIFGRRLSAPACPASEPPAQQQPQPTPGPSADLAVANRPAPALLQLGGNLTYTLSVTNHGPSVATGVRLQDALPPGAQFVRVSGPRAATGGAAQAASCTRTALVSCNVGTLAAGQSRTVTIVVRPTRPGTPINRASVAGSEPDPNPANNAATVSSRVRDTLAPRAGVLGVPGAGCTRRAFYAIFRFSDAQPLRQVQISLDGRVMRRTNRNVSVLIRADRLRTGIHRVTAVAVDRSGNRSVKTVAFFRCAPVRPRFTG